MIQVFHDGTNISNRVEFNSLNVQSKRNERVDTCDFKIEKTVGQTFTPQLGKVVEVYVDGVKVFAGTVQRITDRPIGHHNIEFNVTCVDYTRDLDNLLIVERFENTTVQAVIEYLIDTYAPTFTYNNVVAPQEIDSVAFNRIKITQCLKKLADGYNFSWYVDYDKDLHFFAREDEVAPFNITDTSDNYIFESLTFNRDLSQLRNKVLVEGGEVEGATRTVKYAGNGEQDTFDTQYKFAEKPTVTVDGVAVAVGTEYVDQDNEASFDCMWSYQQKYVRFTDGNIPPAPTNPDVTNVDITGVPLYPIIVNIPSPTSILEYGTREFSIKDKSIKSQQQAFDRAIAELTAYANELNEGSFDTYTPGLRAGQLITVQSDLRNIDETFVIQNVAIKPFAYEEGYSAIYKVTLASTKTVGIIDVLQKLLLDEDLELNEAETLLTFLQFGGGTGDFAQFSDSIASGPTAQTGPYLYDNGDLYNYATWG